MVTVNKRQQINLTSEGFDFEDWLRHISPHRQDGDIRVLREIYEVMDGVVDHQQHFFGESELHRALMVAEILADLRMDTDMLVATLVHSLTQVDALKEEDVAARYGDNVASLVKGIIKMQIVDAYHLQHDVQQQDRQHIESVRKLLLALAEDVRVVIIKLAERLHIMRRVRNMSDDLKRQLAKETQDVFAPLASRLGIWQIKWELEDLSFRFLDPESYQAVASMLDEKRIDREDYIETVLNRLRRELEKANIKAEVTGRPKHIYSIWRKMQKKGVNFEDVFDVRATRVLVNSVADCYAVLGIVHSLWTPIRSEFDDYIATPKENNYQSLHTAVIGPQNKTLEVQIRTHDMHQHSEYGVAAHWGYKEGGRHDTKYQEKIAWIRQILEWNDEAKETGDFIDQFKSEVFEDRVYAFTPKGKVVDLPRGATVLDFAYHIHTDVGHRFRGAKVDGKIVPISYELHNGEKVEILTSKQGTPSRDWLNPHLNYIKSSRTRNKVRSWFRQQDYTQNVEEGRDILEKELRRFGIHEQKHELLLPRFHIEKLDDLYAAIGRADITAAQIASAIHSLILPAAEAEPKHETSSVSYLRQRKASQDQGGVQIMGVGGLMTHIARCCKPVPYDNIVGYITRGRGVTIHRKDCPNVLRSQAQEHERLIEVNWGETASHSYMVDIHIRAFDRQGLLRDITNILTNAHLNVISVNTHTDRKTYIATMTFSMEVSNVDQLSQALIKIEHLPNVMDVSRKSR